MGTCPEYREIYFKLISRKLPNAKMVKKGELDSSQENNQMTNTYMKKGSPSLVTKEMEIRTTVNTTPDSPVQKQLKTTSVKVSHLRSMWNLGVLALS